MNSFAFNKQKNVSLREKVTDEIRRAILNGALKSGERLREVEIADQMGVSRGPVREAIRQLEREGLLINHPYRETVIADLQVEEVKEILIPIRMHLEWFVIRNYIHQMDESFFNKQQNIIYLMDESIKDNEVEKLVELDIQFHENIINLASERTVALTWHSILNQIRLHFIKNISFYDSKNIKTDHQELLNTLKTKDLQLVQKSLIHHIQCDESFLCF